MRKNFLKKTRIASFVAALLLPLAPAVAADSFDPATGLVTIGSLIFGDTEYRGVVIVPSGVVSASTTPANAVMDTFDPATGQLTLRSIAVGGTTYTNVVVTVGALRGVGASVPASPTTPVIPNDPLFSDQWHLRNTGQKGQDGQPAKIGEDINATLAWNLATGRGIQIAVVDDGLDVSHEDFTVVAGKSWDYRVNAYGDPSSTTGSHGTSCAGLAAATGNNGIGVTGVAFQSKIVGYNLLSATTGDYGADSVTKDLGDNHIYTNSYGATDGLGIMHPSDNAWQQAIETGLRTGRNGRGAIYTWAAGNGAPLDRADYDGQANFYGVIAVGALNSAGQKASYSEPGANLLVMGYGGEFCSAQTMTTTDITGSAGYNDGTTKPNDYAGMPNYTRCVNGTSSATPEVAGVTALMLEVNPVLTWRDVRLILARTARQVDPAHTDWVSNGAGLKVNHDYGYGAVDAFAAVKAARTWVNVADQKTARGSAASNTAIPDAGTAVTSEITLSNTGIKNLEFVEFTVTSDHPDFGELQITLTSPSHTVSTVALPHSCKAKPADDATVSCGTGLANGFRFGVARLIGEAADGKWTLSVQDSKTGNAGTLKSWDIRVMGY